MADGKGSGEPSDTGVAADPGMLEAVVPGAADAADPGASDGVGAGDAPELPGSAAPTGVGHQAIESA